MNKETVKVKDLDGQKMKWLKTSNPEILKAYVATKDGDIRLMKRKDQKVTSDSLFVARKSEGYSTSYWLQEPMEVVEIEKVELTASNFTDEVAVDEEFYSDLGDLMEELAI